MSKGWVKLFTDGSYENGSDELIEQGKASWSNGRLDNIEAVDLCGNGYQIELNIPKAEWHQFDRYLVSIGTNKSIKQFRVVQAKIQKEHINMFLNYYPEIDLYSLENNLPECNNLETSTIHISEESVGKWITLVGDEIKKKAYLIISDKGKV